MRLAVVEDRALIVTEADGDDVVGLDVGESSHGRLPADPRALYERWAELRDWAAAGPTGATRVVSCRDLGNPAPMPRQALAVGLNYHGHAAETGASADRTPIPRPFSKFPTSLTNPYGELPLTSDTVDWEVELVVVIGARATKVAARDALAYIAGYAVGQDFTDRALQQQAPWPNAFAKCFPNFGPIGPWVVTGDEIGDAVDLEISCDVNGARVQTGRTSDLIWPVADLIEGLSSVITLLPGDVLFTGTPAGVGFAQNPPRYLSPGDEVVSRIEGIGEIRQICTSVQTRRQ